MKYLYKIVEIYEYDVEVESMNDNEALKKVKRLYKTSDDGYIGVANANTFKEVKFNLVSKSE